MNRIMYNNYRSLEKLLKESAMEFLKWYNANVEKHYQIIQEMNSYRDTLLSFANMTFWQRVKHIFSNKVGGDLK